MKDSEVLRTVRHLIANGTCHYICHAIDHVGRRSSQAKSLIKWVESMLGGGSALGLAPSYGDWLREHGYVCTWAACAQGRLAWLDWMIDYCEKEEAKDV